MNQIGPVSLYQGDCLDVLRTLASDSCDALVTDPPAGIAFMGKAWDEDRGDISKWSAWLTRVMREAMRVLKPGAHGLVWALPRTSHWTGIALEHAGFEIRDKITHVFGQGFPKSLDIAKAIDKRSDVGQDETRRVCRFLNAAYAKRARVLKAKDIAKAFGVTASMINHWFALDTNSQPLCPTWEQWEVLRGMLDFGYSMDDEVWKLNGRKGKPGSAWLEREVIGEEVLDTKPQVPSEGRPREKKVVQITKPNLDEAKQWQGWGTALKPASEDWWLVRKPLPPTESIADSVIARGTGALNIDGSRVGTIGGTKVTNARGKHGLFGLGSGHVEAIDGGRFPPNFLMSHSPGCACVGTRTVKSGKGVWTPPKGAIFDFGHKGFDEPRGYGGESGTETVEAWRCADDCPVAALDRQSGITKSQGGFPKSAIAQGLHGFQPSVGKTTGGLGDTGGASRFFPTFEPDADASFCYAPKAAVSDKDAGLKEAGFEQQTVGSLAGGGVGANDPVSERFTTTKRNTHPTVKGQQLMRWLVRLVTPPGGTVLDCFAGSGSTLVAAVSLGFTAVGIEKQTEYVNIIEARVRHAAKL